MMPAKAQIGARESGFKRESARLSPWMPVRLRIHAVTVVPMLAPMITPTDCESFMMPELTKPTTITVVAEED